MSQHTPPRPSAVCCTKCGGTSHTALACSATTISLPISDPTPLGNCTKCGRWNHSTPDCTASLKRILAYARKSGSIVCGFCEREGHSIGTCPRTKPSTSKDEPPPTQRRVCNIVGTKFDSAPLGSSWILELVKMNGETRECAALGCRNAAVEGAHVWLEGERRFYFIAPFCKLCNHRHGGEEICHCRYVHKGEDPQQWIAIKDTWLYKIIGKTAMEKLEGYCKEKKGEQHSFRDQCCKDCPGIFNVEAKRRKVEGIITKAAAPVR